jgi:hypothetical protein
MGKYDGLRQYLLAQPSSNVDITFAEIETILNASLPESAHKYREWWANDQTHVEAQAWLSAGWKVQSCNLVTRRVVFQKGL